MIRQLAPDTFGVQCDGCGSAGVGADSDASQARRLAALTGWRYVDGQDRCPKCTASPMARSLFPLGQLVATAAVAERLTAAQIAEVVRRHARGDWGNVCNEDAQANAMALREGSRVISVYEIMVAGERAPAPKKVWVITEADRSSTTVLFAEEY